MVNALHGKGAVPRWLTPLLIAEQWGVPPWEVESAKGGARWVSRYVALQEARAWANEERRKINEANKKKRGR